MNEEARCSARASDVDETGAELDWHLSIVRMHRPMQTSHNRLLRIAMAQRRGAQRLKSYRDPTSAMLS